MPHLDAFTLITGIASLIGFAVQMFDLFPRFAKARQSLLILAIGIFLGSVIRAVEPAGIRLEVQFTGFTLLVAVLAIVIVGLLSTAAFTADEGHGAAFLRASIEVA